MKRTVTVILSLLLILTAFSPASALPAGIYEDFESYTKETGIKGIFVPDGVGIPDTAQGHGTVLYMRAEGNGTDTISLTTGFDAKLVQLEFLLSTNSTGFGSTGGLRILAGSDKNSISALISPVCGLSLGYNGKTTDMAYTISASYWYTVKMLVYGDTVSIKVWRTGGSEPAEWMLSQTAKKDVGDGLRIALTGGGGFTQGYLDNVRIDPADASSVCRVTAAPADDTMGTVTGSGDYVRGESIAVKASPLTGYRFLNWTDGKGNVVSVQSDYVIRVSSDVKLTAHFEPIGTEIQSFMAEGLTTAAEIDKENKTVTLRFASDTDLSAVYPYFYLDAGVNVPQKCYERMDLSSGRAVIGTGEEKWTILAEKNSVMRTFYVDAVCGSDADDGLAPDRAFKTLGRAKDAVSAISGWTGDVVVNVAEGEYFSEGTLAFDADDCAEKGYAVIWQGKAENPAAVTVTGGIRLGGNWRESGDVKLQDGLTVWEYDASDLPYSRDLYVDGELASLSSILLDDSTSGSWAMADYADMKIDDSFGYIASGRLADMYKWRNPSDLEFAYEVGWTYSIVPVASVERTVGGTKVNMMYDAFRAARTKSGVQICDPNRILNCFEGLSEAGEWYFDRAAGRIYFVTADTDNPNTMDIVLPVNDRLISVEGSGENPAYGFTLKDMTFRYTSYLRPHTYGQAEIQASYIVNKDALNWEYYHQHDCFIKTDGGITVAYAEGARVTHCIFTDMSASACDFEIGCRECQFVRNTVKNVSANGLSVGGVSVRDAQPYSRKAYVNGVLTDTEPDPSRVTQYTLVMSNLFDGIGLQYKGSAAISAGHVADITISHNTIRSASYTGISAGWGWGAWDGCVPYTGGAYYTFPDTRSVQERYVMENNDISGVCQRLADGGAVYTLSNMPGSRLCGNVMHDNRVAYGGIYFDEGTGGFTEIRDNVVYNCHTPYFYHLVGSFLLRKEAMDSLIAEGGNYIGVTPAQAVGDARYREITSRAGYLREMLPPSVDDKLLHHHTFGEWVTIREKTCAEMRLAGAGMLRVWDERNEGDCRGRTPICPRQMSALRRKRPRPLSRRKQCGQHLHANHENHKKHRQKSAFTVSFQIKE